MIAQTEKKISLKHYFFVLFSTTLIAISVWLVIFFNVDPNTADSLTIAAFFASIFWAIVGIFTFIGFYLRVWLSKRETIFQNLAPSIRQAILLALTFVGILAFSFLKVLSWWTAIPFIIICFLAELYFQTR